MLPYGMKAIVATPERQEKQETSVRIGQTPGMTPNGNAGKRLTEHL